MFRIEKKNIKLNLHSHIIIYFCKNISGVLNRVKTGPLKESFMSSILELIFNSNKVLNSCSRCLYYHKIIGKFLKTSYI